MAVASALMDLRSLPYEEQLALSLDELVRQADYALLQAATQQKLAPAALRVARTEDRRKGSEAYHFQTVDILPGSKAAPFVTSLRGYLRNWSDGAAIRESGSNRWTLSVNGVDTHVLRLYPGHRSFPASQDAGQSQTVQPSEGGLATSPETGSTPAMARPRLRRQGEEPKLVIVMDDLGASRSAVHDLLALNYPVTFAFWPHGGHTREGALAAHAKGREIIVHLPMEPIGYPKVKPGPNVLLTSMDASRIRAITEGAIRAVPHATGLNNHMGSRFTQHAPGVDVVLEVLRRRGLFMLDSLTHSRSLFAAEAKRLGIGHHRRNVFLDVTHSKAKVLEALRKAEHIAQISGQAVAIGHPLPETLAALKDWQRMRDKSVRIVRLSDLVQE